MPVAQMVTIYSWKVFQKYTSPKHQNKHFCKTMNNAHEAMMCEKFLLVQEQTNSLSPESG